MAIWDELDYFTPEEFDYPDDMDENFLRRLDLWRRYAGVPIYISSDFRPGDKKAHGQGVAVDATDDLNSDGVSSHWRYKVTLAAYRVGFQRIGVYDKHSHVDDWADGPQERLWIGESE